MTHKQFQQWLNDHGADIVEDGKRGPQTRRAIFDVFSNLRAPAATAEDIARCAARLGGTVRQVRAVSRVESAGGGFNDQGQPKALYERHYLWRLIRTKVPFLADPMPGGYTLDADRNGINDSWEKLADAAMLYGADIAFQCASFGKFQIMGAHAKRLGYANAVEFAYALSRSEAAHYEALARFIIAGGAVDKFRALSADWRTNTAFSVFYNGPKQKGYDKRLAEAMR